MRRTKRMAVSIELISCTVDYVQSTAVRTMRRIVVLVIITVLMFGLACATSSAYVKDTTADDTTYFAESLELVLTR